ncbi:agmatine deiminase family protein [Agaribacterium haliotis]|uniref:agmatine deiminase family protein n=1 Tax=Agaribacterium haliotis TaxID=2013869 RepID=UPI000BB53BB0|nr:agmatine deiminase family protein [Agaribacterium haliotis]
MNYYLPPEWHPQDAVVLTWPHSQTDWASQLDDVERCYRAIAREVLKRQTLLVVCHDEHLASYVRQYLLDAGLDCSKLICLVQACNDTWARDHGPLTLVAKHNANGEALPCIALDFIFNGWGGKYESQLDNQINSGLVKQPWVAAQHQPKAMVLEGGAIEVDGQGHLLTTAKCLLNKNRNPGLSREQIEQQLNAAFATDTVLWLEHGALAGDDTDAHIDTLARFAPNNTIVYVRCDDEQDSHYDELKQMQAELEALRNRDGEPFSLVPLPWPKACFNEHGERLPATYANFLVINGAVLMPAYGQPERDQQAAQQLQKAFPEHDIIAIDCLALIRQFGSLHCISMQLPKGFLK